MRFFDSTVALLASQILSLLAAFAINLAISRTLGDTGKGLVTMLVYVPSVLFSISHLGMGAAMQYFVSRNDGSPRAHLVQCACIPSTDQRARYWRILYRLQFLETARQQFAAEHDGGGPDCRTVNDRL